MTFASPATGPPRRARISARGGRGIAAYQFGDRAGQRGVGQREEQPAAAVLRAGAVAGQRAFLVHVAEDRVSRAADADAYLGVVEVLAQAAFQREGLAGPAAGGGDRHRTRDRQAAAPASRRAGFGGARDGGALAALPPGGGAQRDAPQLGRYQLPRRNLQRGGLGDQRDAAGQPADLRRRAGGQLAQLADRGLDVGRSAVLDDLRVARIGHRAGVGQALQHRQHVGAAQFQGKEVLADFHIVVLDTAQGVAVAGARVLRVAGGRPRRRAHLHHHAVALRVPGQHALGVAPRRAAGIAGAGGDGRIVVELVVPHHVVQRAVVDLAEGGPHRVGRGVADAAAALCQAGLAAAGVHVLLAEALAAGIALRAAAELAAVHPGRSAAAGEGGGIELEREPPVDRVAGVQQRRRGGLAWLRGGGQRQAEAGDAPERWGGHGMSPSVGRVVRG
ncbi:hypothetical protein CV_0171 [Chromobacterium violaceum ATCC 12472]|uniref:Uncharacterized protein n=1 Tax=Chromobacterium violaceum (strain ATCC 12472 / DSM 30191 / JCM 1249 / CCUG 213 / NBRC 12614 / NCIMB 9131 / NCTC 9757 / MK) TaxID=243365 RepID=Q7P1P2_CHRVO|nr:hypothetical protein CV_0171 [Chromobacterium violaceum ATCC 12472]